MDSEKEPGVSYEAGGFSIRFVLKSITLGEKTASEKALTDTSKFGFGLTGPPLPQGLPQMILEAISSSGPTR